MQKNLRKNYYQVDAYLTNPSKRDTNSQQRQTQKQDYVQNQNSRYSGANKLLRNLPEKEDVDLRIGDNVILGHFLAENGSSEETEEIIWRVLDVQGDRALLLSDDVFGPKPYDAIKGKTSWKMSNLNDKWIDSKEIKMARIGNLLRLHLLDLYFKNPTVNNHVWLIKIDTACKIM